jgi:hypothetical protein
MLDRAFDGFRYGRERDNQELRHPDMVAWARLGEHKKNPERERRIAHAKDLDHVRNVNLVAECGSEGFAWRRDVWIGAVGKCRVEPTHVVNVIVPLIRKQLAEIVLAGNPDCVVTIVSPLAPGIDVAFVEAALEVFKDHKPRLLELVGGPEKVLPMPDTTDPKPCLEAEFVHRCNVEAKAARERICERVCPADYWKLDLSPLGVSSRYVLHPPSGEHPRWAREELRESQRRRETAYVVERTDYLLLIDQASCAEDAEQNSWKSAHACTAAAWWNQPATIGALSSVTHGREKKARDPGRVIAIRSRQ